MDLRVRRDVPVAMRDGVVLATDVWHPENAGTAPTLLARLPYGKDSLNIHAQAVLPNFLHMVEAGYVVVIQDTRGAFASDGVMEPLIHEADDGADTVAWIRQQPWSDGTVGMFGASYVGWTQWEAASTGAAGLQALAPALTTTDYYRAPWYASGGAFSLEMTLSWSVLMATASLVRAAGGSADADRELRWLTAATADREALLNHLPVADQPALRRHAPWYREWLQHPDRDDYWRSRAVAERYERITAPALQIGGWYDIFLDQTLDAYVGMRRRGGTQAARDGQRLIIGPWDHIDHSGIYAGRDFGPRAGATAQDLTAEHRAFYDRWLRNHTPLESPTPVRLFVMGADEWRDEQDWPPPGTDYVSLYLSSDGRANTADGTGRLDLRPAAAPAVDAFHYNPLDPVPTIGGRTLRIPLGSAPGPLDQSSVEARHDVLCYTSPVLEEPVEVIGPVSMTLHVSSSAQDTDITGKLVDVFPDGRALILTDGILRLRYRNGLDRPTPLAPGVVQEVTVDLGATANVFLRGHRVRLEISSSNFPRFDRNTNTGGFIADDAVEDCVVALNRIHTGPDTSSRLILPVVSR